MSQPDVSQQPTRQFREPRLYSEDTSSLWAAIQANQKDIADSKLATAQALGVMSTQLATIQATVSNMTKLLENKQDREEDKVYRAWQNERYSQVSPQQQQTNRYNRNVDIQTICIMAALILSMLAAFGVHL